MALKILRFISLLLVTLIFGLAFCHVMEIPGKFRLNGTEWLAVQQNLYITFGTPIGASIEVLSILLSWVLAIVVRKRRPSSYWTIAAALCVTLGLAAWFALVAPMNAVFGAWTPEAIPTDWTAMRNHWEWGQAVHAVLFGLGFSALVIALLVETPQDPAW